MKTFTTMLLAAALAVGGLGVRAADLADCLLAVVNDAPITQQGVENYTMPDEDFLIRQLSGQPDLLRRRIVAVREIALQTLVNHELILHDFKANLKVPESFIDDIVQDRIKERIKEHAHGDTVELTKQLEAEGITREQFKQQIRDQLIIELMRGQFVREPIISPVKIEEYYAAHHDEFKIEDQIKMRMIVLNKNGVDPDDQIRKRAGEILSQIKGGASFEDLARTYSEGSQKAEGGETGWEDVSVVNKDLAAEAAKLKPGQYSDVIEVPSGFYILLLEDRHSSHFKPLNDVRDQIEKLLSAQETDRLSRQWIDRLRKKTFVEHF